MSRDDSIRYSQHDSSDSSDMNRRIYECIYSYVPNSYMQTYLISRRSSLLFATFVASVARAVVVAKTRAAAQSATCIVYLQVLWVLQPPSLLFSLPHSSRPYQAVCVCECVYYYYYAQLCTRLQLLIIIMNPCPLPPLSPSLLRQTPFYLLLLSTNSRNVEMLQINRKQQQQLLKVQ